jgi:uncharacterized membrane protein YraQ (UPF0718 family)
MGEPRTPKRNFELGDSFVVLLCLAAAGFGLYLRGWDGVERALRFALGLTIEIAPMMALSLVMAAFVQVLVPQDKVSRWLGAESGWRGLVLATAAGALVPGGPWTSFPLLYALGAAGADIGALVAFLSAWELLSLSRVVVWEIPFMGGEFVLIRTVASLALPIAAGYLARRLPVAFALPPLPPVGR